MLSNYLKIAWRSILRDKSFSLINIGGLAIGIAACLLILQYVAYERSYDKFHLNASQVYRVKQDRFEKGALATGIFVPDRYCMVAIRLAVCCRVKHCIADGEFSKFKSSTGESCSFVAKRVKSDYKKVCKIS